MEKRANGTFYISTYDILHRIINVISHIPYNASEELEDVWYERKLSYIESCLVYENIEWATQKLIEEDKSDIVERRFPAIKTLLRFSRYPSTTSFISQIEKDISFNYESKVIIDSVSDFNKDKRLIYILLLSSRARYRIQGRWRDIIKKNNHYFNLYSQSKKDIHKKLYLYYSKKLKQRERAFYAYYYRAKKVLKVLYSYKELYNGISNTPISGMLKKYLGQFKIEEQGKLYKTLTKKETFYVNYGFRGTKDNYKSERIMMCDYIERFVLWTDTYSPDFISTEYRLYYHEYDEYYKISYFKRVNKTCFDYANFVLSHK